MDGTDPRRDHDDPRHAALGKRRFDHNALGRSTGATAGEMGVTVPQDASVQCSHVAKPAQKLTTR